MLTIARCTQAVVWIQVMGSRECLSAVEGQVRLAQGTLPIPRELLQTLVVSANRTPPIHGMCYSRRSSACIQVMGAEHSVSAARAQPVMQGTSMAARVVHDVYAELRHKQCSVARSVFAALCCHIANGERLVARGSLVSKAPPTLVVCTEWCDVLAFQEVLPACSVLEVLADARAVEAALRGWTANDQRESENGSPSVVVQRRVEFLAA